MRRFNFSMLRTSLSLPLFGLLLIGCSSRSQPQELRLNQIQVIGTHNSYHQRAHDSLMKLMVQANPQAARELDYGHRSLTEQLSRLNIRQIELDVYVDSCGGRFAHPIGPQRAIEAGLVPVPSHDLDGKLLQPGFKVLHVPDIDFGTSALTLGDALQEVREWSKANAHHVPLFILIELKDESLGDGFTRTERWGRSELAELEREILEVFPRQAILTPDDIRGTAPTLPEALRRHGWPLLNRVRGKVMFAMDNQGQERTEYLRDHPALEGRLMFVNVPPENPAAAWMERNDPVRDFDQIKELVQSGFLVRTRSDVPTEQARAHDVQMRDHAFASGAQFISTDYPEPNICFSPYRVTFNTGNAVRLNPVNGPSNLSGLKLE